MNIIAVIPARAGSKRLPGKNIKKLGGKPLIAWSIQVALNSKCFERVIVSTEDSQIASIAKQFGAEVPRLRSKNNATDEAKAEDVALEVLENIYKDTGKNPEAISWLQPTSPFRTIKSIQNAVALYKETRMSVISVSPAKTHPYWCKTISDEGNLEPYIESTPHICRKQDLPLAYELNGSIYLASAKTLIESQSFYSIPSKAIIIDNEEESLDIDTQVDWLVAESIIKKGKNK